ncbi:uncharacterized protein LOC119082200 [Bradysia coprophila]|uniref:uncharacterized protein LOC119082200 n=1 Tax=Bradysia coprophila TaxID=38358 RepID=UPI00187D87C5|nr:uncharacterized protein LOC119082200 [Bradysia coprophila]
MPHPSSFTKNILVEQLQLAKAEKRIQSLIDTINAQLNELLVEELQLKSNQLSTEYIISDVITETDRKPTNAEIIATYDSQLVNQQVLDASTLMCAKNQIEEDDDE